MSKFGQSPFVADFPMPRISAAGPQLLQRKFEIPSGGCFWETHAFLTSYYVRPHCEELLHLCFAKYKGEYRWHSSIVPISDSAIPDPRLRNSRGGIYEKYTCALQFIRRFLSLMSIS